MKNTYARSKLKKFHSDAGWAEVDTESDSLVLSTLLWSWIDQLKEPILTRYSNR